MVISTARQVRAAWADIAFERAGCGEPVVFVHAGCADRRMWDAQFTELSKRYRVFRHDWRGRGGSGDAVGEFGVIPEERLRRYEAGAVECIDPADLDAVAAADTEFLVVGEGRDRTALGPEVWRQAVEMDRLARQRIWGGPRATELTAQPTARERLAEVTVPTLVISGQRDVPEILEVSGLLAREIREARYIELPDTGHLPSLERPTEVTVALEDFLVSVGFTSGRHDR